MSRTSTLLSFPEHEQRQSFGSSVAVPHPEGANMPADAGSNSSLLTTRRGSSFRISLLDTAAAQQGRARGPSAGSSGATASSSSPLATTSNSSGVSPSSSTFINIRRRSSVRPFGQTPDLNVSDSFAAVDNIRPLRFHGDRITNQQADYEASPDSSGYRDSMAFSSRSNSPATTAPSSVDGGDTRRSDVFHTRKRSTTDDVSIDDDTIRAFAFKPSSAAQARRVASMSERSQSSKDPWFALGAKHVRRASFQNTSPYTSPNLTGRFRARRPTVPAGSTRFVRLALKAFALTAVSCIIGNIVLSTFFSGPSRHTGAHVPLPDTFASFINDHEGPAAPTLIQARPEQPSAPSRKHNTEGPVLDGRDLVNFRRDVLWGPPEESLLTDVLPPRPGFEHESTIIFMHGLTQHTYDNQLADAIAKDFPSTRWVMPQAPHRPVTTLKGDEQPAWFDMRAWPYDIETDQDTESMYASTRALNAVIESEIDQLVKRLHERGGLSTIERIQARETLSTIDTGLSELDEESLGLGSTEERAWAASRMVVAGFSQGSVMSLLAGVTNRNRLGGIVLISSFLPLRKTLPSLIAGLNRQDLPIFWGHGSADPYLLHSDALVSKQILERPTTRLGLGMTQLEFHTYQDAPHVLTPEESTHVATFLNRLLPKPVESA
ncbi:hypothetical protein OIV83_000669 [Microbotryomycetes sp. JL201]|nr:hypothetical protein OIV83_000669 [Microbotryomycetes sp. JL201]